MWRWIMKLVRGFALIIACGLALSALGIDASAMYWPVFGYSPGFGLTGPAPCRLAAVAKALPGTAEWYAPVIGGAVPVLPGTAYGLSAFRGNIGFF
jgi:hypothetical protein